MLRKRIEEPHGSKFYKVDLNLTFNLQIYFPFSQCRSNRWLLSLSWLKLLSCTYENIYVHSRSCTQCLLVLHFTQQYYS